MAKKQNGKQKSMEETLWDSANKLRGTVESSEYKISMCKNESDLARDRFKCFHNGIILIVSCFKL